MASQLSLHSLTTRPSFICSKEQCDANAQNVTNMAHTISDRWLWLGVGIAFFIAVKGIKYAISDIVNITQLPPDKQDSDEEETKYPEDSTSVIRQPFLALIC